MPGPLTIADSTADEHYRDQRRRTSYRLLITYLAPLILLAQNRQADRDRLSLDEDRRRAAMQKADTEFLTREIASLRIALGALALLAQFHQPVLGIALALGNRWEITTFGRAEDAIEIIEKGRPDLVLLDIGLPGMDGVETLKAIKNQTPLVEVIMLTGHANVEVAVQGMELGAFDYLMKPCDMDQLIQKVNAAAKRKRDQEEKIMEARMQAITLRRP